jgi:hypothetical protein
LDAEVGFGIIAASDGFTVGIVGSETVGAESLGANVGFPGNILSAHTHVVAHSEIATNLPVLHNVPGAVWWYG